VKNIETKAALAFGVFFHTLMAALVLISAMMVAIAIITGGTLGYLFLAPLGLGSYLLWECCKGLGDEVGWLVHCWSIDQKTKELQHVAGRKRILSGGAKFLLDKSECVSDQ
jgi:hypothetical protein